MSPRRSSSAGLLPPPHRPAPTSPVVPIFHLTPRCHSPTGNVSPAAALVFARAPLAPPLPSAPVTESDRVVVRAVALVPSPMATGPALLRPRRRPLRLLLPPTTATLVDNLGLTAAHPCRPRPRRSRLRPRPPDGAHIRPVPAPHPLRRRRRHTHGQLRRCGRRALLLPLAPPCCGGLTPPRAGGLATPWLARPLCLSIWALAQSGADAHARVR
nr:lysine-rich arabinogalactan protein 19-like [Aegilops tauschii subsp. strangulata]